MGVRLTKAFSGTPQSLGMSIRKYPWSSLTTVFCCRSVPTRRLKLNITSSLLSTSLLGTEDDPSCSPSYCQNVFHPACTQSLFRMPSSRRASSSLNIFCLSAEIFKRTFWQPSLPELCFITFHARRNRGGLPQTAEDGRFNSGQSGVRAMNCMQIASRRADRENRPLLGLERRTV